MNIKDKRLYRSRSEKKIAGVCGGIAEYFGIDPTIVRLAWAVFACCGGVGIGAYIVAAIIIPEEPTGFDDTDYNTTDFREAHDKKEDETENPFEKK